MEIVSASHTLIRQNTCSHSTWPPLSVAGSQPFDQLLETDSDDLSAGITAVASTVSQRRRVNPENLALRLGPDLVRDLEALIQPGNIEMPSFAVRKELQERYNIDRRHIYDYFHSRGLRVIKDDKHGNAIVPNDLAPAPSPKPNLRVRIPRQASTTREPRQASTANLASTLKQGKPQVSKPRGVMKAKPGRRRKHAVRSTHHDSPPYTAVCTSSRTAHAVTPLLQPDSFHVTSESNKSHEFDPVVSTFDEFHSFAQAMHDTTHCGTPVFETSTVHSLSPATPDLRIDGSGLSLSPHTPSADPLSPNFCTLSSTERSVLYPLLSGVFDTRDIQECAGTYRAYMQERSRLYYEGLLAVPYQRSRNDRKPASSGDHQLVPSNGSEFRRWVNPRGFCVLDEKASVSRNKPVKAGASPIRQKTSPVLSYTNFGIDNEAYPLDTLFPMIDQNKTSVDESPVVHTRRQSYLPLDFYYLPNAENSEGDLLDAAPSSGAPELPERSHSVSLQWKIRGGESLHGHPDFPGSLPLLPSAELHLHVNPNRLTPPLQQPVSSLNNELGAFTLKQKSSGKNLITQTRFAPCTPPKLQLREYDRIRTRSLTSRSARRRTTSAGGGI